MKSSKEYLEELARRAKKSKVYQKHQLIGLQIAETLGDEKHKALYIKLAKTGNQAKLQWLAADVADRRDVRNKGAYFMTMLKMSKQPKELTVKKDAQSDRNNRK